MSDLISRQDVIDALELSLENDYIDATEFLAFVQQLPSAEPERKKGKWLDAKAKQLKTGEIRNVRKCSECGSAYFIYDQYNSVDEIPKYCPTCGADMRGE